jgi:hypothetical protein
VNVTAIPLQWFCTEADAAELDVLVHALVADYWEHRKKCRACIPEPCAELEAWRAHKAGCLACQGDAPLTYPPGPDCRRIRAWWLSHGDTCPRCNPCPHLQSAIREVADWWEVRLLLSRAEALRREFQESVV